MNNDRRTVLGGMTGAALLAPFGLAALPLMVMELGARWILFIAHWIAGLDGAVTAIPAPGPWVMPLVTLGGIWVILWRGRVQLVGVVALIAAAGLWAVAERPLLLISGDGKLLGLNGPDGRALSAASGGGFAAQNWLENDGDLADQKLAAGRGGFTGKKGERWFVIGGVKAVSLTGKGAVDRLSAACATGALVVLAEVGDTAPEGCRLIDQTLLRATGPLAFWPGKTGLTVVNTKAQQRIWSGKTADPPPMPALVPAALDQ